MKKLAYNNNWECDEYWVDGKRVLNLTKVAINNVVYPVTNRMVTVPYNDMGHKYTSTSKHFFVVSMDLGVEIDLNRVVSKNDITAIDYEVEHVG